MKKCSKCSSVKSITEFHNSAANKDGKHSYCKECVKLRNEQYQKNNKEQISVQKKEYYRENKETIATKRREFYEDNREEILRKRKEYYENNKDVHSAYGVKHYARNQEKYKALAIRWRKNNPAKSRAYGAAKKAQKLKARPSWAIDFFIEEIYALAKLRTKMLGYVWHVDHIVPLQHPLVCGLHCEANLRVIPAVENLKKGNRWWPDMPD